MPKLARLLLDTAHIVLAAPSLLLCFLCRRGFTLSAHGVGMQKR